ncbi:MAG: hypothetical protein MR620_04140, partial [Clostridiales bacterium]|nr:hypothetical protein [Clostridiales bacterium]
TSRFPGLPHAHSEASFPGGMRASNEPEHLFQFFPEEKFKKICQMCQPFPGRMRLRDVNQQGTRNETDADWDWRVDL